ncbi:hypothetical protein ABH961_005172 [Bacillus sp. RC251]
MRELTKDPGGHRVTDPGNEAGPGGGAAYVDINKRILLSRFIRNAR